MRNYTGSKYFLEVDEELRRKILDLKEQNEFLLERVQEEQDRFQELLKEYKKLEIKLNVFEQVMEDLSKNK